MEKESEYFWISSIISSDRPWARRGWRWHDGHLKVTRMAWRNLHGRRDGMRGWEGRELSHLCFTFFANFHRTLWVGFCVFWGFLLWFGWVLVCFLCDGLVKFLHSIRFFSSRFQLLTDYASRSLGNAGKKKSSHPIDRHKFWNEIIPSWVSQTWSCRHIASWCHLGCNQHFRWDCSWDTRGGATSPEMNWFLNIFKLSCRDVQPKTKSI